MMGKIDRILFFLVMLCMTTREATTATASTEPLEGASTTTLNTTSTTLLTKITTPAATIPTQPIGTIQSTFPITTQTTSATTYTKTLKPTTTSTTLKTSTPTNSTTTATTPSTSTTNTTIPSTIPSTIPTTTTKPTTTTSTPETTTPPEEIGYNKICNATITESQCKTLHAVCAETGSGDKCICQKDQYHNPYGNKCDPKIGYNKICNATITESQCKTLNAVCAETGSGDKCICQKDQYHNPNGNKCDPKIGYNTICNATITESQCKTLNAVCAETGSWDKCICQKDQYHNPNGNKCDPKKDYNEMCNATITENQCKTSNAVCAESENVYRCICQKDRFHDPDMNTCDPKLPFSSECKSADQCETVNSICDGKCSCNATSDMIHDGISSCVKKSPPYVTILTHNTTSIKMEITRGNEPTTAFKICPEENEDLYCENSDIAPEHNTTMFTYPNDGRQLTSGTCYIFNVIPLNGIIEGTTSFVLRACTSPDQPTYLKEVVLHNKFARNIPVEWGWNSDCNTMNFTARDQNESVLAVKITDFKPPYQCSATVENLNPSTNYTISVMAYWNGIYGQPSSVKVRTGFEPPLNCTHIKKTSTMVILQWTAGEGDYDSFYIQDNYKTSYGTVKRNKTLEQNFSINDLLPGKLYYFYILSTNSKLRVTSATNCSDCTYMEPAVPKDLKITNIKTHSFDATWTPGDNSLDDYYEVSLNDNGSIIQTFNVCKNETSKSFDNLDAGSQYTVDVIAAVGAKETCNDTPLQSNGSLTGNTFTRPSAPPDGGNITSVTETGFTVSWIEDTSISFKDYSVYLEPDESEGLTNTNISIEKGITTYTFPGLYPGTDYTVKIYTVIGGLPSEQANVLSSYTVPVLLPDFIQSVADENLRSNGFNVMRSNDGHTRFEYWLVIIRDKNVTVGNYTDLSNSTAYMDINNLTSSTEYTIEVYIYVPGFRSYNSTIQTVSTRPSDVEAVEIHTVHENNFTLTITPADDRFKSFRVLINPSPTNHSDNFTVSDTHSVIQGLKAETKYTLEIFTESQTEQGITLYSSHSKSNWSYSGPLPPTSAMFTTVETAQISIKITSESNNPIEFGIRIPEANLTSIHTSTDITISNLTAGTHYTFEIHTLLAGIWSDRFVKILSYTKPDSVLNIQLDTDLLTNTTMSVTWQKPSVGKVDQYTVTFRCRTPNDDTNMTLTQTISTNITTAKAIGLDPGTFCSVDVISHIGNQSAEMITANLNTSTIEAAPDGVLQLHLEAKTSTFMEITWTRPSTRNGIIRKYYLTIKETDIDVCVKTILLSCCEPDIQKLSSPTADSCRSTTQTFSNEEQDAFSVNVTDLHPYRNYTAIVIPHTIVAGKSLDKTQQTLEDVPTGPPEDIMMDSDSFSLFLNWTMPVYGQRNGKITHYTIYYNYTERMCSSEQTDGQLFSKKVNYTVDTSKDLTTSINNLYPFWTYSISISASTKIGDGPVSGIKVKATKQARPGDIDTKSVNTADETDNSFRIDWSRPCHPNGIITNYTIKITNKDKGVTTLNTTSTNISSTVIESLLPYSNYSVIVAANTDVGTGNFTNGTESTTALGKPHIPQNPVSVNTNYSSMKVQWKIPSLYTGPTRYTVVVTDEGVQAIRSEPTHPNASQLCETGINFYATECVVQGLDAYWNYSFVVTAYTGNYSTSTSAIYGTTEQAAPGNVTQLALTPEANITLPRSIIVTWNPPVQRDLNGIIIAYYISYERNEDMQTIQTGAEATRHEIKKIGPGNYIIKVFATTAAGNGSIVSLSTEVPAGAPIKIPETGGILLIQSAPEAVKDAQTQVAIELPLQSFLCNTTNGPPNKWGVIVAQNNQAQDAAFFGSREDFEKKETTTYKKWFDVKDDDSIAPYVATRKNYDPCKATGGNRKRRSATSETASEAKTFVIGEDGECSGVGHDINCNGQLQPGRSYRIKNFVCTENGCTETEYSEPIKTAKIDIPPEKNLVPVIAGVVSAVVVIAIVVVVTVFMKRRQKGCFAKDAENTYRAGSAPPATEMVVSPKSYAFRPRPVKIAEFPEYVASLYKDSGLLFSDAYKMLKENSPAHPTTAAEQQNAKLRNRYTNILAFDHSRVKLLPLDDEEGSDYINANYIPGYTSPREYIATQGPTVGTLDDFWRMVWEQNVDSIVMLTKLVEKGRAKCDKYWPELNEPLFYGDLVVSIQSESNLSDYTIRIIEVKLKTERRVVRQFAYLKWPDMGCPDNPALLLDFVKAIRQHSNASKTRRGPIIVHCSAGVGRTGTFIAVDHLLQHIRDHDEVDIYNLVLDMRNQRCNMVQTEDQYVYIHECLKDFITMDDEDDEEDDEPVYENTNTKVENVYENTAFSRN